MGELCNKNGWSDRNAIWGEGLTHVMTTNHILDGSSVPCHVISEMTYYVSVKRKNLTQSLIRWGSSPDHHGKGHFWIEHVPARYNLPGHCSSAAAGECACPANAFAAARSDRRRCRIFIKLLRTRVKFPIVGENQNNGRYTDLVNPDHFTSVRSMWTRINTQLSAITSIVFNNFNVVGVTERQAAYVVFFQSRASCFGPLSFLR